MSTETEVESTETTPAADKTAEQLALFTKATEESSRKADARQAELLAELRAQNQKIAEAAQVKIQPEKIYTEDELQELVDANRLKPAVMARYLARVEAQAAAKAVRAEIEAELKGVVSNKTINDKIEKYADAIPALRDQSSDEFKEFAAAYKELVAEGKPETVATELDALRAIYGRDPSKHSKSEVREKTSERRTQETTGSRGSKAASDGKTSSGIPKFLPPTVAAHYERMIEKGVYKSTKDPAFVAEMKIYERKLANK